jgi:carbamoyl-phosphate synthase large subunit
MRCVLLTRAGTGASNNLVRSLRRAAKPLRIVGCHDDRFLLRTSTADRNFLVPPSDVEQIADVFRTLIETESVDLVIPTTDTDVRLFSDLRETLPPCLFLPNRQTVNLCQDKYALTTHLRSCGVTVPMTYEVTDLMDLPEIFRALQPDPWLWCRVRAGSGSLGATPVRTVEQAAAWLTYWEDMRGVPVRSFTLAEYLPGRDFACQSLWRHGELILIKTTERLSYFQGTAGPSGVSSIGAVHRTVYEPRVAELAAAAVFAVDSDASGAFSVDMKEDARGCPSVTEINVGRFLTGSPIFDESGQYNMTLTYVDLAFGRSARCGTIYDVSDCYMIRDLDTLPGMYSTADLGAGIIDLTATGVNSSGGAYGLSPPGW